MDAITGRVRRVQIPSNHATTLTCFGDESLAVTPYADDSGNPSVRLSWPNVTNNESGFILNRSTDGGPYTQLKQLGADVTGYVDTSVHYGTPTPTKSAPTSTLIPPCLRAETA